MLCLLVYLIAVVLIVGLAFYGVQRTPLISPAKVTVEILLCVLGWGYHLPMKCS